MEKVLVGSEVRGRELHFIIFDVPFACNFRCKKCYRLNTTRINFEDKLFLEQRLTAVEQSKLLGARVLAIPGEGEPFHPAVCEITLSLLKAAHEHGLQPLVYTNGYYLSSSIIEALVAMKATVIFSLDASTRETFATLTGVSPLMFDRVVANFLKLKTRYSEQGLIYKREGKLFSHLGVITVINELNKGEMEALKQLIGQDVYHIVNFPVRLGNALQFWNVLVKDVKELMRLSQHYTDAKVGGLSTSKGGKCSALYHGLVVDADGMVQLCPAAVDNIVGHISEGVKVLHERRLKMLESLNNPACLFRLLPTTPVLHDNVIVPQPLPF